MHRYMKLLLRVYEHVKFGPGWCRNGLIGDAAAGDVYCGVDPCGGSGGNVESRVMSDLLRTCLRAPFKQHAESDKLRTDGFTAFGEKFELQFRKKKTDQEEDTPAERACRHHLAYSYPLGVGAAFVAALPDLPRQLRMEVQALGVDEIDLKHTRLAVQTLSDGRYFRLYSDDEKAAQQRNRAISVPRGGSNVRVRTLGGPWRLVRITVRYSYCHCCSYMFKITQIDLDE